MYSEQGLISLIEGEVVVKVGGKIFCAPIKDGQKFSINLKTALDKGENPAEAFVFLAELCSKSNVYGDTHIKSADRKRWFEFFGVIGK